MIDTKTNRLHFTKAAQRLLRAPFARAGHDIRMIDTVPKALSAWADTLTDQAAVKFLEEIERRTGIA